MSDEGATFDDSVHDDVFVLGELLRYFFDELFVVFDYSLSVLLFGLLALLGNDQIGYFGGFGCEDVVDVEAGEEGV